MTRDLFQSPSRYIDFLIERLENLSQSADKLNHPKLNRKLRMVRRAIDDAENMKDKMTGKEGKR